MVSFFCFTHINLNLFCANSIQGWGIALAFFLREICHVTDGI